MTFKLSLLFIILAYTPIFSFTQENNALLCSDGFDNDGDGLIDCQDGDCLNFSNNGCLTCIDGISFADILIDYIPGCPVEDDFPQGALGLTDWTGGSQVDEPQVVILGQGGSIKLGFTNNLITNSGNPLEDIWIFEVGPVIEACNVELHPFDDYTIDQLQLLGVQDPDNDGYFDFGSIGGSISGLDIDNIMPGYSPNTIFFDAIEINDIDDAPCGTSNTPGADIDAVCAVSSMIVDCNGEINGLAVMDECDQCLQLDNPNFNNCLDCEGSVFGAAIIDECGQCLDPDDPSFNACFDCDGVPFGNAIFDNCNQCLPADDVTFNNCLDCEGTPFGTAVTDDCGECLELDDVEFNSCYDCAGILNGASVYDECGQCLSVNDVTFNNCFDCDGIPFGLAVLDDCGECLDPENPEFNSCYDCAGILNGTSVYDECGQCRPVDDVTFNNCLDCAGIPFGTAVTDDCGECLDPENPEFNSCYDCAGISNGTSVYDECGQCLSVNDESFNNCLDCDGIPFGTAVLDDCGECLEPEDAEFNQLCQEISVVYVPNAFSPDNDGINEVFSPVLVGISKESYSLKIFDRWGEKVFESKDIGESWIGDFKGSNVFVPDGVYVWQLNVKNQFSSVMEEYIGHVTVIR